MKELKTMTEYQVLFLARCELLRRLDKLNSKKSKSETGELSRRDTALFNLYSEHLSEVNDRMLEINTESEEEVV